MIKFEKFQKIILNFFSLKTRINLNAIIIYRRIAIFQIKNSILKSLSLLFKGRKEFYFIPLTFHIEDGFENA